MNGTISKEFIYCLASKFRKAMDEAYRNEEFKGIIGLRDFPNGSCGITSCLLGEYLMEHGIPTKYINRTYYYGDTSFDSQAHTWLELTPNLIVDITGDQFKSNSTLKNYSNSVYVGAYNGFYNLFESTPNSEYKLIKGQILSPSEKIVYNEIKKYLNNK